MSATLTLNAKAYDWSGFNTNNAGSWKYSATGIPTDFSYLTARSEPQVNGKASTVRWNLAIPHVATAATSCSCPGGLLGTDRVRIHAEFYPGSTTAERTDVLARLRSLVLTTDFANSFVNLTQPSSA